MPEPPIGRKLMPLDAREFAFGHRVNFKPPLTPDATRVVFPAEASQETHAKQTSRSEKTLLLLGAGVPLESLK